MAAVFIVRRIFIIKLVEQLNTSEQFQTGLDLIYCLDMVPIEDVTLAWDQVILPFFEENFVEDEDVESFIGYVEKAYIGRLNHRTGQRKKPMFPAETWNIHQRILNDQPTTNNSVEAWNSRWNHTLGTGHNILTGSGEY